MSLGLQETWRAWRNGLLAQPAFQRWAADFPLTRPIAHQRTDALFHLVAGFVYSQTLLACVQLEALEALAKGPKAPAVLAAVWAMPEASARRLLLAAAALGLADEIRPDRFALGEGGAALLGSPGLRQMIAHHALVYADLSDPVALLRAGEGTGGLAAFWPYAGAPDAAETAPAAVSPYSALMAATQPGVAADVLAAYPVGRHRRLLDLGGGEGVFALAAARAAPRLDVTVFDLPAVAARAQAAIEAEGLATRVRAIGGDFMRGPLPQGFDLISFVRILHDHDDAGVAAVLGQARAAIAPQGCLLIAEPMSGAPRRDPVSDAYFGFYLLAMGRGRARRPSELKRLLEAAGFFRFSQVRTRTPALLRVLLARPRS